MERWYPPAEEMSIKALSISGTVLATARVLTTAYTGRVSPEALSFIPITNNSMTGGWVRPASGRIGMHTIATG